MRHPAAFQEVSMSANCRIPAFPLVVNDPYFSVWSASDQPTQTNTTHWCGPEKPLYAEVTVQGETYRLVGLGDAPALQAAAEVTPLRTIYRYACLKGQLTLTFWSPSLPQEPDLFSIPATFVECAYEGEGEVEFSFTASGKLCYDGENAPELMGDSFLTENLQIAYLGQTQQKLLCHSGDHVTIDWGYLYLASAQGVIRHADSLAWQVKLSSGGREHMILAYDEVVSILYFGTPCKPWYARNGKTLLQALCELERDYRSLYDTVLAMDQQVMEEAAALGGEDYELILSAAFRHTMAAHKLIATPAGEMALLSKEDDSNGCIGTVDVSYPSSPFFLKYNPELVDALCRPVLEFAAMPIWDFPFAPHDVGRYPIVGGQVYAFAGDRPKTKNFVYPPIYLYPAGEANRVYNPRYQMPVEECGNMIVMLTAAWMKTGDPSLIRKYGPILTQWVKYLQEFGEDPADQLCTDDFAGHLARNVNLSAKAVVGLACYAKIAALCGDETGDQWEDLAGKFAASWYERTKQQGLTPLTFDGEGWSMKYNLAWDRILGLNLMPEAFYDKELSLYPDKMNRYGLPLDSRKTYTKSDWILWTASMARDNRELFGKFVAPIAAYLRESNTRVAFSDWYDTVTGDYVHFIARSVQGGLFMPLL